MARRWLVRRFASTTCGTTNVTLCSTMRRWLCLDRVFHHLWHWYIDPSPSSLRSETPSGAREARSSLICGTRRASICSSEISSISMSMPCATFRSEMRHRMKRFHAGCQNVATPTTNGWRLRHAMNRPIVKVSTEPVTQSKHLSQEMVKKSFLAADSFLCFSASWISIWSGVCPNQIATSFGFNMSTHCVLTSICLTGG